MASLFKAISNDSTLSQKEPDGAKKNKQRVLILTSRGVTYRHRHLLNDIVSMMPHGRKESKWESKKKLQELNEIAELLNCNSILFFEARKRQDLYLWLSRAPNGPCVKFHLNNLHTSQELNFVGNSLKGSRPIVSFDKNFDATPATALIKEMLMQTFGVPKGARKSKPFIDRVVTFTFADGKVWFRHYQITETAQAAKTAEESEDLTTEKATDNTSLVEIGPRFVMTPIVILEGSFGGPVIYENREFVSPNAVRSEVRKRRAVKAIKRDEQTTKKGIKKRELASQLRQVKAGEIDDAVLFG